MNQFYKKGLVFIILSLSSLNACIEVNEDIQQENIFDSDRIKNIFSMNYTLIKKTVISQDHEEFKEIKYRDSAFLHTEFNHLLNLPYSKLNIVDSNTESLYFEYQGLSVREEHNPDGSISKISINQKEESDLFSTNHTTTLYFSNESLSGYKIRFQNTSEFRNVTNELKVEGIMSSQK